MNDIDKAIANFKAYIKGENSFDELDFKEAVLEAMLPLQKQFIYYLFQIYARGQCPSDEQMDADWEEFNR